MDAIEQLTQAHALLAKASTVQDVVHLKNMAQAAEQYARAERLGEESERYAREIRVRCARKAGEILREMKEKGERDQGGGGNRRSPSDPPMVKPTLADLGVKADQSSRWQRLATVPDEEFEEQVKQGWGEEAIVRGGRHTRTPEQQEARMKREGRGPKAKQNGFTERQSLQGLQNAAISIEGLAEALDGQLFGDWSRLHGHPDAQRYFAILEANLPVVSARIKRALKEWKESAA